jgi:hypothetical protein
MEASYEIMGHPTNISCYSYMGVSPKLVGSGLLELALVLVAPYPVSARIAGEQPPSAARSLEKPCSLMKDRLISTQLGPGRGRSLPLIVLMLAMLKFSPSYSASIVPVFDDEGLVAILCMVSLLA